MYIFTYLFPTKSVSLSAKCIPLVLHGNQIDYGNVYLEFLNGNGA